jgi:hypothetical protein
MQQKSALPEFHHYRKLGRPDAHEVGFSQQNNDKEFKIASLLSAMLDLARSQNMRSRSCRSTPLCVETAGVNGKNSCDREELENDPRNRHLVESIAAKTNWIVGCGRMARFASAEPC